jgi:hypothetical protein
MPPSGSPMYLPLMPDDSRTGPPPGNVFPLSIAEEITRQTVRDIEALFPGWHVWTEAGPARWHARREADLSPGPGDERRGEASAADVVVLVAFLERQVRLDLAVEFPDWTVKRAGTGWQAVHDGCPADRDRGTVCLLRHQTLPGLFAALRELAVDQ